MTIMLKWPSKEARIVAENIPAVCAPREAALLKVQIQDRKQQSGGMKKIIMTLKLF